MHLRKISTHVSLRSQHSYIWAEHFRYHDVNSVPNDKTLDWIKLKAFADDQKNMSKKMEFAFEREENTVEKRKC